ANHLPVDRPRGGVVRFSSKQLRTAGGETGLRLGNVGACDLADIEAVLRLPQRRLEHVHVAALKLKNRGITQEVHVGGDGREQDRLLGVAQRLAGGKHLAFGLPCAVAGLESVVEGLGRRDAVVPHGLVAGRYGYPTTGSPRTDFEVLLRDAAGGNDPRTIAAERDRQALVGRTGGGTLGIELRVVLVGLYEGAFERVGRGRLARDGGERTGGDQRHPRAPCAQTRSA